VQNLLATSQPDQSSLSQVIQSLTSASRYCQLSVTQWMISHIKRQTPMRYTVHQASVTYLLSAKRLSFSQTVLPSLNPVTGDQWVCILQILDAVQDFPGLSDSLLFLAKSQFAHIMGFKMLSAFRKYEYLFACQDVLADLISSLFEKVRTANF
jgi:hypothetical protein